MAETIKTGTILIKDATFLPDALQFESEPCATGWRLEAISKPSVRRS